MKYNQNTDNKMSISKSSSIVVITVIFLFAIFRLLLPYGDEPDFNYRVESIVCADDLYSHYFFFQNFLKSYAWSGISQENIEQKILRIVITLCAVAPLIFFIIFKKQSVNIIHVLNHKNSAEELSLRLNALSLSLLLPGMLYHLGVFAEEQFTLVLSLLVFLFWNNRIILLSLISFIIFIDFGNSIVIIFFILFFKFFEYLNKKYSIKFTIFLLLLSLMITYFVGMDLILLLSFIPIIGEKASLIFEDYSTYYDYVATKYPLIMRPVITFFAAVFMTPEKVGAYILYPIYAITLMVAAYKLFRQKNDDTKYLIYFIVPITFLISVVFMLPGYSQAKYYMFIVPFVMYGLTQVVSFNKIFIFLLFSNITVILSLLWNLL